MTTQAGSNEKEALDRPLRVLNVHSGNLYGGIEVALSSIARACMPHGVQPEYALCFEGRTADELRTLEVPVRVLGPVRLRQPWRIVKARAALEEMIAARGFDLVIAHSTWALAVFASAVRASGVPLVFHVHDTVASKVAWLNRLAQRHPPDYLLCNSEFTASTTEWLFPGVPRSVVYYPLEPREARTATREATRRALGIDDDTVVVFQASRMQSWKGHQLHLAALKRLDTRAKWVCLMAGGTQRPEEEAYAAALRRTIDETGLGDRVRLLGQRSDVPALMAAADVFCQPNKTPEPFGLVFLEALAAGLPVVSVATGGVLEIVDASCGILAPPGDAEGVAAALSRLIDDRSLRASMSAPAKRRAREISDPDRQGGAFRKAMESAIRVAPIPTVASAATRGATARSSAATAHGRPLRVLHVHSGNLYGGIEVGFSVVAKACLPRGIEPEYALCFEGRATKELRALGVPVHVLGAVRLRQPWRVLRARRKLTELLASRRFDLVVAHSGWSMTIFAPVVTAAGVPLVFHVHDTVPEKLDWLSLLARRTRPDLLVCNSEFTAGTTHRLFPGVPLAIVHYPLEFPPALTPSARAAARRSLGIDDDTVFILQASRMQAWKGHELHLSALARIHARTKWVCLIAGGAQRPEEEIYEASLRRTIETTGLGDRVRLLGQRTDVPTLMAAADIFCQPNKTPEPFGLVFLEALAAGCPVVSVAMGGVLEMVDSSCGILAPPGDADGVAAALSRLIDDEPLRKSMSAPAMKRAHEISDPDKQTSLFRLAMESVLR